jgi:hypothetical protein
MFILISEPEYHLRDDGYFRQQEFATLDEAVEAAAAVEKDFRSWYIFQGQQFPDEEWIVLHERVEKRGRELLMIERAALEERQRNKEIAQYRELRAKYGDIE